MTASAAIHDFQQPGLPRYARSDGNLVQGPCAVLKPKLEVRNDGKPKPRPPAHDLWAALIARIYVVFQLICPMCGGQTRIIAFITFSADTHKILEHIGVEPEAPRITPHAGGR